MAQSVIVRHQCQGTAATQCQSPATLLVSRNVAIDCVQLQVRVHSAQQRSRALLASLLLSKNDSIVCQYLLLSPFSRRRQNCLAVWTNQIAACTCSNTSRHQHCNLIGPNSVTVWRRREKCWCCCRCRLQSDWSKPCDSFGAGGKMSSTALRYYEQTIYCHFLEEAD